MRSAIAKALEGISKAEDGELTVLQLLPFASLLEKVNVWTDRATAMCDAIADKVWRTATEEARVALAKLQEIAGGMLDGSDVFGTKDPNEMSFDEIQAHFKQTLFKQKGLSVKFASRLKALKQCQQDLRENRKRLQMPQNVLVDALDGFDAVIHKAQSTQILAQFAQSFKDEATTDGFRQVTDQMTARNVSSADMPKDLWFEV